MLSILLVDNDVEFTKNLVNAIRGWGHAVVVCTTSEHACMCLRHSTFDLVLLDLDVPDCRGQELIPFFKMHLPNGGIITLTRSNSPEMELAVRQMGIYFYMMKPVDKQQLQEIINHIDKKSAGTRIRKGA